ncbi:MAG: 50S ribosomal protein L4 [Candidatus Eutrophobiaceae bacterium]
MELAIAQLGTELGTKSISLSDEVFSVKFNEPLIHQVVVAWMAGARSGSKAQKSRSDVRGSGIKPWRQKGTGRARAGTRQSPLWRGGGVTFAASPRDHSQKVNRKMYRGAMRSILSELIRQERLICMDSLHLAEPKTKRAIELLESVGLYAERSRVLIVMDEVDLNLELGMRNLYQVMVVSTQQVNPRDLIDADKVLFARDAIEKLEGSLK